MVKLIYAPNKNTKFFLLRALSLCRNSRENERRRVTLYHLVSFQMKKEIDKKDVIHSHVKQTFEILG